ncbi:MAG: relaxase domain-containing protein [Solirubrobacteraceae bacterium]
MAPHGRRRYRHPSAKRRYDHIDEPIRPVGADGTRTAGVDLTFSPPKDVSALWATSSDYRRRRSRLPTV